MYCSSCGGAVARDLSYCNHCGSKLAEAKGDCVTKPAELFPDSLVWAIVGIFIIGLGCLIGLMAMMKAYHFNDGLILGFAVSIFALMAVIEAVFIGLLLSRKSGAKQVRDVEALAGRRTQQTTKELEAAEPRALPEPVASITEHTTRAFEPVYRERKAE